MKFSEEQIATSLYDLFFNKIEEDLFIEKFLALPIERASDEVNKRNKAFYQNEINYYKARYDEYLILNEYTKNDFEHLIILKTEQFLNLNGEFDKDVFYRNECLLFVDSIKDYLDSFNKGKYLHIDTVKENNQFQFELSYNRITGKTVLVTTKNLVQLEIYFKSIIKTIDKILNKIPKNKEKLEDSNIKNNKYKGFKFNGEYEKLSLLRKTLIDESYISKEISLSDFRAIFDNKEVKKKITWIKSLAQLNYLITILSSQGIIKADEDKKWVTTVHCFELKKKALLVSFDSDKIRLSNKVGEKPSNKMYSILKSINIL